VPIVYDVEIVLRERNYAVTERLEHPGSDPAAWTERDVASVLKDILRAIDRVRHPDGGARPVALRGFSWIVEPTPDGVVIAIEIQSGAAVAGPFRMDQRRLDRLVSSAIAADRPASPAHPRSPVVH
jgi:hypothetical protein